MSASRSVPGSVYVGPSGGRYEVLDETFADSRIPIGRILKGPNRGIRVVLVNAPPLAGDGDEEDEAAVENVDDVGRVL